MIGFDIGGTKCAVTVGKQEGSELVICAKRVIPTDHAATPYEMIDRMYALACEMTDEIGTIGISCGGPLSAAQGVILSPPNLPGWDDVHVVDYIAQKYKKTAYLENDANACAVAEWQYGAGRGCQNMLFFTFGTGFGAGLILDGHLYRGASDMAGEVGHLRLFERGPVGFGKAGSFEGFCSGGGLAQLGKTYALQALQCGKSVSYCASMADLDTITAKSIAVQANAGAEDAIAVYRDCGEMLGRGLSLLIDILNPECLVLGSIYARCEHLLREPMMRVLERECLPHSLRVCRILPAALGESIGDYASLGIAAMHGGQ